jgi:hypothetical protein
LREDPKRLFWVRTSLANFIEDQIRGILDNEWDAIGVADIVDDEYDMYIGHIHSLLATEARELDIADYLL